MSTHDSIQRLYWVLVLTLSLSLASANYAQASIVYCAETSPLSTNPVLGSDLGSQDLGRHIYDNLIETKADLSGVNPGLAESWTVSPDHLRYVFKLRQGVQFQTTEFFKPTRNLNADDVVFSLSRLLKTDHPYYKIGAAYPIAASIGFAKLIKDLKKIDDRQIAIDLHYPYAAILELLAFKGVGAIFSKEYADLLLQQATPELLDSRPIGSGPYILKSFERGSRAILHAHKEYFRGTAQNQTLIFSFVPEAVVRNQKLLTGECHVIFQPDIFSLPQLTSNASLQIDRLSGSNVGYVAMNMTSPRLKDAGVRHSLFAMLNRQSYISTLFNGYGELANAPLPKGATGYKDVLSTKALSAETITSKLKTAGFEFTKPLKMMVLPISRTYLPSGRKLGELIQADLKKYSINLQLEVVDWATYIPTLKAGNYDLAQLGWNTTTKDSDFTISPLLTCDAITEGLNIAKWCNKEFDALILQARKLLSNAKRVLIYEKALKVFAQDLPWIPIAHGEVVFARLKKVKGFSPRPDGSVHFYQATNE